MWLLLQYFLLHTCWPFCLNSHSAKERQNSDNGPAYCQSFSKTELSALDLTYLSLMLLHSSADSVSPFWSTADN